MKKQTGKGKISMREHKKYEKLFTELEKQGYDPVGYIFRCKQELEELEAQEVQKSNQGVHKQRTMAIADYLNT